jgi:hypothetical protein
LIDIGPDSIVNDVLGVSNDCRRRRRRLVQDCLDEIELPPRREKGSTIIAVVAVESNRPAALGLPVNMSNNGAEVKSFNVDGS